jgi:hypothetical protein
VLWLTTMFVSINGGIYHYDITYIQQVFDDRNTTIHVKCMRIDFQSDNAVQ